MPDEVVKARARPMTCPVKGCEFVTDPTCETRLEVREDLTFHRVEVHEAAALLDAKIKKESADSRVKELKAEAVSAVINSDNEEILANPEIGELPTFQDFYSPNSRFHTEKVIIRL